MSVTRADSIRRLGFWAATLSTVFALGYVVAQLAEWLGLLGSGGVPFEELPVEPDPHHQ